MTVDGIRQSDRISLRLQVEASWLGQGGAVMKQPPSEISDVTPVSCFPDSISIISASAANG